jgi:lipoprotein-releasing system ATP-binding protein
MVQVTSLNKIFYDDAGPIHVLRNADLTINKGEMVALIGRSGAGKTTLLQILGGIDSYTSGNVVINEREISSMNPHELSLFRGKYIGFVFQFHHLLPDFTALENIFIPGLIIRRKKGSLIGRAKELLSIMGLENRFSHFPAELSGGERQRVALARALFNEPALILADEPTGNLDTENSTQLMKLIMKANTDLNQTFLIATHNEHFSEKMNRKIFIEDGKIFSNIQ